MMTIKNLKNALAEATPGQWYVPGVTNYIYSNARISYCEGGDTWDPVICVTDDDEPINYEANARLIVLMKNSLPALIEAVSALQGLVDLKDLKDQQPLGHPIDLTEYRARKPAAWKAARAALEKLK